MMGQAYLSMQNETIKAGETGYPETATKPGAGLDGRAEDGYI
jgi:hypothetical protein